MLKISHQILHKLKIYKDKQIEIYLIPYKIIIIQMNIF
jgi:hypothetical protein